jgi:hypothetical protein
VIKSIEPYSFTKGTLKEEVFLRHIKPTKQAYLDNVRLLICPFTCDTIVKTRVQWEGRFNIVQDYEALIIRAGSLDDDKPFPSDIEHVFDQSYHT